MLDKIPTADRMYTACLIPQKRVHKKGTSYGLIECITSPKYGYNTFRILPSLKSERKKSIKTRLKIMEVMKNKSEEMIWKLIKKKLNPGQD